MHAADQQFFARLASLNDSFASGLPSTLERLGMLGNRLDPLAPAPVAAELAAMLHTLAGSALTFGYRGLGQHARALEQRLRVLMAFDAVAGGDWSAWLSELAQFVEQGRCDPHAFT